MPEKDPTAAALLEELFQPRRRARPRLAAALAAAQELEVATPQGPVAVWRTGPGPAVLLVHGWEDDNALWGPMLDLLERYGRSAVVFDLPGHGFSGARFEGVETTAAALGAVVSAAGPLRGVAAHSFGCMAVVCALAAGLETGPAVLIASPLPSRPGRRVERRLEEIEDRDLAARAAALLPARAERERFDALAAAAALTGPGLFLHALDDEACPPEGAARLAAAWPGASVRWFEDLGHRAIAQEREVLETAFCFIEGVDPALFRDL